MLRTIEAVMADKSLPLRMCLAQKAEQVEGPDSTPWQRTASQAPPAKP
jgi:hypothetical protein